MTTADLTLVIILRLIGVCGLFAIPAIFLPYSWMNANHENPGLGTLLDAPIVSYLTRSLSAFYAAVSAMILFVSFDIRRYRSFIGFWAVIIVAMGCMLLGIDIAAEMPLSWTLSEGPPTIAAGLVIVVAAQDRCGIRRCLSAIQRVTSQQIIPPANPATRAASPASLPSR